MGRTAPAPDDECPRGCACPRHWRDAAVDALLADLALVPPADCPDAADAAEDRGAAW